MRPVLLFDVNETLLDLRALEAPFEQAVPDAPRVAAQEEPIREASDPAREQFVVPLEASGRKDDLRGPDGGPDAVGVAGGESDDASMPVALEMIERRVRRDLAPVTLEGGDETVREGGRVELHAGLDIARDGRARRDAVAEQPRDVGSQVLDELRLSFHAVFAVPFRRLPPPEDLPGDVNTSMPKMQSLVEGVDLSAGR